MIIDNLPTIPSPVTAGDELAVERGTTTYKIDYNALAAAILAQAVKKSGDTMTGPLITTAGTGMNVAPSGERAYIWLNPQGDYQSDVKFRCANTDKWTLSSRNSNDDYYFGLYNYTLSTWSIKVYKDNAIQFEKPLPIDSGGTGAATAVGALNNFLKQTSRTSIEAWNSSTSVNTYASFDANTIALYFQLWYSGNFYGGTTEERFRSNSNDDTVILLGEGDNGEITRIGVSINWSTNRVTLKHGKWANSNWTLSIYKRT